MSINSLTLFSTPNSVHNFAPAPNLYSAKFGNAVHFEKGSQVFKKIGGVAVSCGAKNSDPEEEKQRTATEVVLKLYEAIKNKNVNKLSDIIADECTCSSNIFSAFQIFRGKKQVLDFFSCLMKKLGDDIVFVVQPTLDDGIAVGVSWKLEWKQVHLSLGKGFSVHTYHIYRGHAMIENVEIFMEPLLQMEPLRLMITLLMAAMEKIDARALFKNDDAQRPERILLFSLLILAAILLVFKFRKAG
ncbi:uncharacterized protein LOC127249619 isoform X2 [Andrographis paniculata]|uniref:uncharacterized protein LOC127249619 isoform X2 n=1 Tax=Andrographis paniculata TaxID=175694 RepID=UPI0021E79514|nr:uncharacterized protein LOC127249619 isoform X2 [Andrographis paniculata]